MKLTDLGYFGEKEVAVVEAPVQSETKGPLDFSGVILDIDQNKKTISFKGIDLVEQKQVELNLLVNDNMLYLSGLYCLCSKSYTPSVISPPVPIDV